MFLLKNSCFISLKLFNLNKSILEKAIYKSIMIKLFYVKRDEKELLLNNNSRAMLNFGHTIGHAIESYFNYKKEIDNKTHISFIDNIYFKKTLKFVVKNLEPKFKRIKHKIQSGETFDKILNKLPDSN